MEEWSSFTWVYFPYAKLGICEVFEQLVTMTEKRKIILQYCRVKTITILG